MAFPKTYYVALQLRSLQKSQKKTPGIISALLQQYDPFSVSMSKCEINDILQFLKNETHTPLDQQTNFGVIKNSIRKTAQLVGKNRPDTKNALIEDLTKEMEGKAPSGLFKVFRLVYGNKSRGPAMITKLREIGFEIKDDIIPCFKVNPYNGRHHAFIIEAQKPGTSSRKTNG